MLETLSLAGLRPTRHDEGPVGSAVDGCLRRVVLAARRLVGAEASAAWWLVGDGVWRRRVHAPTSAESPVGPNPFCDRVLNLGAPVVVPDTRADGALPESDGRFFVGFPVETASGVVAVLCLHGAEPRPEFVLTPFDRELLADLCGLVADVLAVGRRAEAQVGSERARLRAALDAMHDGVAIVGEDTRIRHVNPAFRRLFPMALDGSTPYGMLVEHVAERAAAPEDARQLLGLGFADAGAETIELARPERRVLRRVVQPITGPGGGWLLIWQDTTAEADRLTERTRAAETDALTGLVNRRGGLVHARRLMAESRAACVGLLDIDRFKHFNDACGHAAGDDVLRLVAHAMAAEAREGDVAVRWGGDEFLVIVRGELVAGRAYCERVRARVALSPTPCGPVAVSIGVVQVAPGEGLIEAAGRADAAMDEVKAAGGDGVRVGRAPTP